MSKWVNDAALDAALDWIADANLMVLCSQQPSNRTEAVSTYALADAILAASDFTKADGDVSGRKLTIGAQSAIEVDASGTGNHVALCNGSDLVYVTICTDKVVDSGGTVDFGAWDVELADPS